MPQIETVNAPPVKTRSKPYHHGDLRAALVHAGMELLATRTVDDLSLREIARTVGVSANAVYRHFADKESLMRALSAESLQMLYVAQRAASDAAGGGVAGFIATGAAYVRFALENPALFRQVFSNPQPPDAVTAPAGVTAAMAFLRDNAAGVAGSDSEAEIIALEAWSLAHGLAMLMLDARIAVPETMISGVFTHWAERLRVRRVPAVGKAVRKRRRASA